MVRNNESLQQGHGLINFLIFFPQLLCSTWLFQQVARCVTKHFTSWNSCVLVEQVSRVAAACFNWNRRNIYIIVNHSTLLLHWRTISSMWTIEFLQSLNNKMSSASKNILNAEIHCRLELFKRLALHYQSRGRWGKADMRGKTDI